MGQVYVWPWLVVSAACTGGACSLWFKCRSAKIRALPRPRLSQAPSDKCSFLPPTRTSGREWERRSAALLSPCPRASREDVILLSFSQP